MRFVLATDELFLNTSSDARLLPALAAAAHGEISAPTDAELASDAERFGITALFDGAELERHLTISTRVRFVDEPGTSSLQRREEDVMSQLSDRKRASMPSKDFGLPEKARTPEQKQDSGTTRCPTRPTPATPRPAPSNSTSAGNLTKDELERINRKADRKLDK